MHKQCDIKPKMASVTCHLSPHKTRKSFKLNLTPIKNDAFQTITTSYHVETNKRQIQHMAKLLNSCTPHMGFGYNDWDTSWLSSALHTEIQKKETP
jgi:hypothetical protein